MKNIRLIARLDVKGQFLIKGVHLEGLRKIGNPQEYALKYYQAGADELIYMDVVASLYGRNNIRDIVERTAENVFIPITVGGGIRSVSDARDLLRSGADKVAINTAAIQSPMLLTEIAEVFGTQSVVLSVEATKQPDSSWVAYTDNGRERSKYEVLEWVQKAIELGAGEILLTSVDREGTCHGFDLELVRYVSEEINVPLILSGGMGALNDVAQAVRSGADAVAMASVLHYEHLSLEDIRAEAKATGLHVRQVEWK
ncbi:cyclase [Alteromonadaceae bacterium Bs31]|nr:cyclase [Alteromonadaceae bacterium Bs31]